MSDPALGLLMLALIVVVIMMGFATAFTLMGLGMFFGFIAFYDPTQAFTENRVFDLMVQRTYGAMTNDVLISIPLFVLMGYVMERGALVDKMFYSIQLAFRRVPASLAVATLIVCTFWGIASGLVGAVAGDGNRGRQRTHQLLDAVQGFLRSAGAVCFGRWHAVVDVVVRRHSSAGGRRGRRIGRATTGDPGAGQWTGCACRTRAAGRLLFLVWAVRRRRRADARTLLLEDERRPLRGPEAPDVVGDAARHSHRRRPRCHSVRNHHGDRVCRRRRRRSLPAGVPGADAGLETHQGSGVLDGEDHGHGVLAVRRLGAVFRGVCDPGRAGAGRAMGAVPQY